MENALFLEYVLVVLDGVLNYLNTAMSDTNASLRSFFGFVVPSPGDTLSCIGCRINLSEFNNFLIHRQDCRWMQAVLFLITQGTFGDPNEFIYS